MSERPYSRVYWSIADDEKFDGVRDDMRLMGSWLTLLVAADMAYPVPAYIPPTVPRSAVRRLVDCGLIDELPGHRYRVHGLEAERAERSQSARNAAAKRWHSDSNASTRRVRDEYETRHDARASLEPIDRIVDVWMSVKYRLPSEKQRAFLYAYLQTFDQTGEARAERLILSNPTDPIAAMKDDLAAFREERVKALGAEVEKPRPRRAPGLPQSARDILAEIQRLDAEKGDAA